MAESGDLIDFNIIEGHKENIQALPGGRSAKALAQIYSPPLLGPQPSPSGIEDSYSKERAVFEQELTNIDEADDPLDVYDRYVKWTLNTYPSAQATPQSGLLPLLERVTKTFQSSVHYRNDPRYLKLWLQYISLFSDAPREVFTFLARHGIGEGLALYYEEFAAWLERAERWTQAEEIYRMGIERAARPAERLGRKFGEFEQRRQALSAVVQEPTSPALQLARPVLAAKLDPFATAGPDGFAQQQSRSTATKKARSAKMTIFTDHVDEPRPSSGGSTKGWDSIGSLADRKKENTTQAKPWAGEKLNVGKTNAGVQKMMIFKDQSTRHLLPRHIQRTMAGHNRDQQMAMNPKSGRFECVFVSLDAVYPRREDGGLSTELCFEELRVQRRGWSNKAWRGENASRAMIIDVSSPSKTLGDPHDALESSALEKQNDGAARSKQRGFKIFEDVQHGPLFNQPADHEKTAPIDEKVIRGFTTNDENDENAQPRKNNDHAKKARREERANRTRKIKVMDVKHIKNETRTIQLNLDSPTGPKPKVRRISEKAEPTMTINTKEAMDEIYGIFNQPLQAQLDDGALSSDGESDDSESDVDSEADDDDEDDCCSDDDSTVTGKASGPPSEYGEETKRELLRAREDARQDRSEEHAEDATTWSEFSMDHGHLKSTSEEDEPELPGLHTHKTSSTPRYRPVPPDGYEPPIGQFRDMAIVANNRLPFMTPIVERTESSFMTGASRHSDAEFYAVKTPSRNQAISEPIMEEDGAEPFSSPFSETVVDLSEDRRRILQPIRTKSTQGTILLGQGSAKSQIAVSTLANEPATKGPLIKDEQCNPMDPYVRQCILTQIRPPLSSYDGYHEYLDMTSSRSNDIKRFIRSANKSRLNPEKNGAALSAPMVVFGACEARYEVQRELGAGTFAPVYLVENQAMTALETSVVAGDDHASQRMGRLAHRKALEAIKMEDPPNAWEFYMICQSHRRLGITRASQSVVRAHELHLFRDECYLVEEYRDQGTLLDLVNISRADSGNGGGMDEMLAMFFAVELIRTVEALHSKQLIHGDLKGDNVLTRLDDPGLETDWSPVYFPSGAHGWSSKGVCLIDFGRGIDMKQFVPSVGFVADWKTSEADCAEMRELRPWTYQIDYYGLAGIIHSLLFGKYMETVGEKTGSLGQGSTKTYRLRETLKRYWQTEIWTALFDLLLNPLTHLDEEEGRKMPVLKSLRTCRESMESWLEEHCEKGVGLKGMIVRLESALRERRRKAGR